MLRRVLTTMSVLVLAACGARPHTFDVLTSAHVTRPAVTTTTTTTPDPAVVLVFKTAFFNAAYNAWLANQPAPPTPISDRRCPPGQVKFLIDWTFGLSAPAFEAYAMRESGCTAGALNPSGASGVLQLMMPMHSDIVRAACPGRDPSIAVFDAVCNVKASYALYLADSVRPWA